LACIGCTNVLSSQYAIPLSFASGPGCIQGEVVELLPEGDPEQEGLQEEPLEEGLEEELLEEGLEEELLDEGLEEALEEEQLLESCLDEGPLGEGLLDDGAGEEDTLELGLEAGDEAAQDPHEHQQLQMQQPQEELEGADEPEQQGQFVDDVELLEGGAGMDEEQRAVNEQVSAGGCPPPLHREPSWAVTSVHGCSRRLAPSPRVASHALIPRL